MPRKKEVYNILKLFEDGGLTTTALAKKMSEIKLEDYTLWTPSEAYRETERLLRHGYLKRQGTEKAKSGNQQSIYVLTPKYWRDKPDMIAEEKICV